MAPPQWSRAVFPWVRLIALDHNPGFAAANNVALRQATGDVCVLLNPDTALTDPALSRLAAYLRAHPACGVVGPRLLNPDGTLQSAGFAPPSLFQVWYDLVPWPRRFYASRLNGRYTSGPEDAPYDVGFPLGAALAVRGDVLDAVGLLDEDYGMYMEELDFCARVWAAGWAVRLVPMPRSSITAARAPGNDRTRWPSRCTARGGAFTHGSAPMVESWRRTPSPAWRFPSRRRGRFACLSAAVIPRGRNAAPPIRRYGSVWRFYVGCGEKPSSQHPAGSDAMMQTLNLLLFAALILGFLVLFLTPGRWWPRSPKRERRDTAIPRDQLPLRDRHTPDEWS